MTDAPTPDDAPDRTPEVPDEATLAGVAEPARVRRAPKIGAFITAGVLLGALIGLVLALVAGPGSDLVADGTAFISILDGQGGARLVCAVAGAVLGGLAGAGAAVAADRRSVRRAERDGAPGRG